MPPSALLRWKTVFEVSLDHPADQTLGTAIESVTERHLVYSKAVADNSYSQRGRVLRGLRPEPLPGSVECSCACAPSVEKVTDPIIEYADYDSFARDWHSDTLADYDISLEEARERGLLNEQKTRQLWQLLGLLGSDELFVQLPEWLADEKVKAADRTTPTLFVGRISRETEDAILFKESAAARPLMELAHTIHSLEKGIENTATGTDRHERSEKHLRDHYQQFRNRDDLPTLSDEWLPKSQLVTAVQRRE